MADSSNSQRSKRLAAAAYDYDGDPRWADYWSNVLLPPNMASRADVVDHFKRKFYQLYIDPDLIVEPISFGSSSQASGPSTGSATSATFQRPELHNSGSGIATRNRSATSGSNMNLLLWNRQTIQFSVNAWIMIVALVGIFPLFPRTLVHKAYRLSLLGSACSYLHSLYTLCGLPRSWNIHSIQGWVQTMTQTKDFMCFLYAVAFFSSQAHLRLALLPLICRALEHDTAFLRHHFSHSSLYRRYLERLCLWVEANTSVLANLNAHVEVALGFLLILSLLSWQRSMLHIFMHWNLLKHMYHAPVTSGYHKRIWSKIGQSSHSYILQYTPFLVSPLLAIQRWWLN